MFIRLLSTSNTSKYVLSLQVGPTAQCFPKSMTTEAFSCMALNSTENILETTVPLVVLYGRRQERLTSKLKGLLFFFLIYFLDFCVV